MEDEDNAGGDAVYRQRLRHAYVLGRGYSARYVQRLKLDFAHLGAEGLAVVYEAVAEGLSDEAAVLRGRRVWR